VPLLFQGEEYGEPAPFLYFVDHDDPQLIEAVRRGRRDEFAAFQWLGEPPDPDAAQTFIDSKLHRSLATRGAHRILRDFHRELIAVRRAIPALARPTKDGLDVSYDEAGRWLRVRRTRAGDDVLIVYALGVEAAPLVVPGEDEWRIVVDSREERWGGSAPAAGGPVAGGTHLAVGPSSFTLLHRAEPER
jgi:maltooligosyltrehalose trehalohydrolase